MIFSILAFFCQQAVAAWQNRPSGKDGLRPLVSHSQQRWTPAFAKILLICLVWTGIGLAQAQARETATPYQLQSAFLYNFFRLVDWPKNAFKKSQDTLGLCLIGEDFLGDALTPIASKKAKGKALKIYWLAELDEDEIEVCHILYISTSEKHHLQEMLHQLRGRPILTASEISNFAELGGTVRFVRTTQATLGLEINMDAARRSRLRISSRILLLAKLIYERPGKGR